MLESIGSASNSDFTSRLASILACGTGRCPPIAIADVPLLELGFHGCRALPLHPSGICFKLSINTEYEWELRDGLRAWLISNTFPMDSWGCTKSCRQRLKPRPRWSIDGTAPDLSCVDQVRKLKAYETEQRTVILNTQNRTVHVESESLDLYDIISS